MTPWGGRIVRGLTWGVVLVSLVLGLTLSSWPGTLGSGSDWRLAAASPYSPGRETPASPPRLWSVPEFTLIDQQGHRLRQQDLLGTVWVASFIFTHCPDVCPLITQQLALLRDALATTDLLGSQVRLVSFTVDPERDRPSVLRRYAHKFKADDPHQWAFLTGEPMVEQALLTQGFRIILEPGGMSAVNPEPIPPEQGVTTPASSIEPGTLAHSNRLLLIDRCGHVRSLHPALEPERFQTLITELRTVVDEPTDHQCWVD